MDCHLIGWDRPAMLSDSLSEGSRSLWLRVFGPQRMTWLLGEHLFTNPTLPGAIVCVLADSTGLYCLLSTEVSPGQRDASPNEGLAQRHSGVQTQAQSFLKQQVTACHSREPCLSLPGSSLLLSLGHVYCPASTPVPPTSTSSNFPLDPPWLWF